MDMPDRARSHRRPGFHAGRKAGVPAPRDPSPRPQAPASEVAHHGEDAGPQAERAPPREDRAG